MQLNSDSAQDVRMQQAAQKVGVSVATLRNWIKSGLLHSPSKGLVSADSLAVLQRDFVGKTKLNSRANKLNKPERSLLSKPATRKMPASAAAINLSKSYESTLSESHRNKEGIFYTPEYIVADMMNDISGDLTQLTFLDPCCGTGNFLIHAISIGFKPENVFGFDTDKNAVAIAKRRILELTGFDSSNVICADFLQSEPLREFDCIFTNPPWGKKLSKTDKQFYATKFDAGKSVDTSSLFLLAALGRLTSNGKLGFLLPESFFNISNFCDVRQKTMQFSINRIIDYGKPFKGLLTKAQAIILSKADANPETEISCELKSGTHLRKQSSFVELPKSILNFTVDSNAADVIAHLHSAKHITLKNQAKWGLGIVTGNNALYCKAEYENGHVPVIRGTDIFPGEIKSPSTFIPKDMSRFHQVAAENLYHSKEKIVYRFISNKLVFAVDTNQNYLLNSANFLVLNDDFPLSAKQLTDLLNSDIVNWLFRSVFNTHKILRGDLELMPIHSDYFRSNAEFDEASFLDFLGIERDETNSYRIKKSPA